MTAATTASAPSRRTGILRRTWEMFRQNRLATLGLVIIVVFGLAIAIHPMLIGGYWPTGVYDPLTGYDTDIFHPSGPSKAHWLGTDNLGRDVASMLLAGLRPTFVLAMVAAVVTAIVSTVVAAIGAYRGGWTDAVLNRISDAFLLLPAPIVMVVIGSGEFSDRIGPVRFGLIYGALAGLGAGAIVLRVQALKIMASPFIDAAKVSGGGGVHIVRRHVLPHLYPFAVLFMMLAVVGAVVSEGFASWFGQTANRLTWGTMVYLGITFRDPLTGTIAWNAILPPAIALSLFSAAFYLVSVGLRQAADPRAVAAKRRI